MNLLCAQPDTSFFSSAGGASSRASTSTTVVTTRVVHIQRPKFSPPSSSPPHAPRSGTSSPLSSPPNSSPVSSPPRKRKSASLGAVPDPDAPLPREVKRLRGDKPRKRAVSGPKLTPRASSQQKTQPPSPEPIYRSSRSRSTSHFTSLEGETPVIRRCWVAEDDGGPDPAHFSSEKAVAMLLRTYCAYFKNLEDPTDCKFKPHPKNYPYVELEYPNTHSSERFILLAPKDKDHYNPIMDVEKTLYTIIECYLTPAQQALFGPIPKDTLFGWDDAPSPAPSPTPPRSHSSSGSTSSLSSITSSSSSGLSSLSDASSHLLPPSAGKPNHLRAVQRAIHRRDGPSFLAAFDKINDLLRMLKYPKLPADSFQNPAPNALKEMVNSWTDTGLPKKVLMRIIEENYQRSVGPHVQKLKQYEAFSSAVYGELMPSLVHEIIQLTKLNEDSLFLDLGSGVGNVVVQASLQTGCRSYGIELNPKPAKVARDMAANFKVGDIELEEGDMLRSSRVDELIRQADVVLVDNKVFEQSLNEQLRPKFLDLKEGAYVVSLAPFVPSLNARVTERNVDDISAIFDVTERPYHSGSVSWGEWRGHVLHPPGRPRGVRQHPRTLRELAMWNWEAASLVGAASAFVPYRIRRIPGS
ncbi:Histone-lysine N-methyltransferase, H3 lysine-79 specific [Mycena venus]|uniref:Histone-lysine N-methyltransferase, H3 lysine-79 specific n=1 Tax=Mycena venus TaxID=2733690 RepID=A0A8H7CLC4_9AGAR|nr:Histone-lysine N-methyltransferase, H3 lysine-79 specific [Mycena venus]